MSHRWLGVVCWGLIGGTVLADVESGPKAGAKLTPVVVRVVEEGKAAEAADLLPAHVEHPTVYVFVAAETFDRPAAQYLRGVDEAVQKLQRRDPLAGMVIVWLGSDPEAEVARVSRIRGAIRLLAAQWTIAPEGVNGPEGWAVNPRAVVTTVLSNGPEVSAKFAYDSVNDTVVDELTKAIDKLAVK